MPPDPNLPEDPKKSSELWNEPDQHDNFLENLMTVVFIAITSGILLAVLLT
jgi:hypothetical protein